MAKMTDKKKKEEAKETPAEEAKYHSKGFLKKAESLAGKKKKNGK
jgi:hypothetical protein